VPGGRARAIGSGTAHASMDASARPGRPSAASGYVRPVYDAAHAFATASIPYADNSILCARQVTGISVRMSFAPEMSILLRD
jgi:hypothetical protein